MLLKLATRNIRRSVRDYAIYFITLLFGVAVFYAFNSIGSQQVLFDIENAATERMLEMTQMMLSTFSAVVAAVLAFLIIYANQMLIRRRKREFGTYLILGMSPGSISRIVLYETVIIGLASLVVGIFCGVLLSQLLSFVTASMFGAVIETYHFVFSSVALIMTLICFAVIYGVISIFNVLAVNRYKLIDLLNADAKNEKVAVRNPWVCLVAFILSLLIIAASYQQLIENGLIQFDGQFWAATALMLVGSFIFFWSLAGFVIAVLTHARFAYLRGLVPFTVRQVASKVNTAFVSLWVVCVMLFFSITTFSAGLALVDVFTADAEASSPFDETLSAGMLSASDDWKALQKDDENASAFEMEYPEVYADGQAFGWDIAAKMASVMPQWDELVGASCQIDIWTDPVLTYGDILDDPPVEIGDDQAQAAILTSPIAFMSLTQYNKARAMLGQEGCELAENEALLTNTFSATENAATSIAEGDTSFAILGHEVHVMDEVSPFQYADNAMLSNGLTFVVPDGIVEERRSAGALPYASYLNIDYNDSSSQTDQAFHVALAKALPVGDGQSYTIDGRDGSEIVFDSAPWPVTMALSKFEMIEQAKGLRMMVTYLALYIGFVFLISTAAILAIQQISITTDSESRYRILSRLGCDRPMLDRSLFIQVLIYFLTPLSLAVCHSACAIGVLRGTLFQGFGMDISGSILMAAAFTVLIYGGYMLVTYFASRATVIQAARS